MKIKVGRTYIDGQNCRVKIVAKIKDDRPYVGIVDWSTCECIRSRDGNDTVDQYDEDGKCHGIESSYDFSLKRLVRSKK